MAAIACCAGERRGRGTENGSGEAGRGGGQRERVEETVGGGVGRWGRWLFPSKLVFVCIDINFHSLFPISELLPKALCELLEYICTT